MKIGIFNASKNTLSEAIQKDSIVWIKSQAGYAIMRDVLTQTVYQCANHDIGFIHNNKVEILNSSSVSDQPELFKEYTAILDKRTKPKQPENIPTGATHIHCGLYYKIDINELGMTVWKLYTKKDGWIITPMVEDVRKQLLKIRQDNDIPEGATHIYKGVYYKRVVMNSPLSWCMWHRGEWRPTLVMHHLEIVLIDQ